MKDVNSSIQKAYYDAISATGYPVYEGEEPDNELSSLYIVLSDLTGVEAGLKSKNAERVTIQVSIHSVKTKINNSVDLNTAANLVLEAIKPENFTTLTADGIQIVQINKIQDITSRNKLGDNAFIDRRLIFSNLIHYI